MLAPIPKNLPDNFTSVCRKICQKLKTAYIPFTHYNYSTTHAHNFIPIAQVLPQHTTTSLFHNYIPITQIHAC